MTQKTKEAATATALDTTDFATSLKELRKQVDPSLIKQREGWRDRNGNVQMVDYIEWHTACDILDNTCPEWSSAVKDIRQIGDVLAVTVALTINGVTREGIGTGAAQTEMGIKKAEHDALKRAAVKFGVARELYHKESSFIERSGSYDNGSGGGGGYSNDSGFPSQPVAQSLGDLVTAKQLGMIRAIAREIGVDPNETCDSLMQCTTDELSKKAASALIQHLQDMQRNGEQDQQRPAFRAANQTPPASQARPTASPGTQRMVNLVRLAAKKAGASESEIALTYSEGEHNALELLDPDMLQQALNGLEQLPG